jgi:hypothetical protein
MLFKMRLVLVQEERLECAVDFPHAKMMLFEMSLFVQEAKLTRTNFPP